MTAGQTVCTAGGGTATEATCLIIPWMRIAVSLIAVASVVPYLVVLGSPLHLDDQFLVGWVKNLSHLDVSQFMRWGGPDKMDAWGPLTPLSLILTGCFGGSLIVYRVTSLLVHCVNSTLVYFVFREIRDRNGSGNWLAFVSALLFALYPLHPEAVSWIGGRASELSTMWALLCLYSYCRARSLSGLTAGFKWLGGSISFLLLSLLTTWTMWVLAPVIAVYEFITCLFQPAEPVARIDALKRVGVVCAVTLLCYCAASTVAPTMVSQPFPQLTFDHLAQLIRNLVFPINQAIWQGYSLQYRLLYIVLAMPLVSLILVLIKNRRVPANLLLMITWLFIAVFPFVGHAAAGTDFYGSRWLYFASIPLCGLMASFLLSVVSIGKRFQWAARVVAVLLVSFMCVFYFLHTKNQNDAYRAAENTIAHIQKSVRIVFAKEHAPLVLVRDVPTYTSVLPQSLNSRIMCFDGATGLLRANSIPDGRLKDGLRSGHFASNVFRWDKDFGSVVPVDLSQRQNEFGVDLDARQIVQKAHPNMAVYKTVWYNDQQNILVLDSNSANGPVISFRGQGLSPTDGDFLYLDAQIQAPEPLQQANIELYWVTGVFKDYAHKERRITTLAILTDNQYHRYYLPLRGIAWSTSGPPTLITLGFPAGSKVQLKGMGIVNGSRLIPELTVTSGAGSDRLPHFDNGFYNYPEEPELGLSTMSANEPSVNLHYRLANIAGAVGGFFQIAGPNNMFADPNGSLLDFASSSNAPAGNLQGPAREQSDAASTKLVNISDLEGDYIVSTAQLAKPGLYGMRLMAVDKSGRPIGNFSDAVQILVRNEEHGGTACTTFSTLRK